MKFWVAVLVLGIATGAAAQQSAIVSGKVIDSSTGRPVAGAIVSLRRGDTVFSERSDEVGAFRMPRVSTGSASAEIRRIGYEKKVVAFDLAGDTAITIAVIPSARRLLPVNVYGKGEGVYGVIGRSADLVPIAGASILVIGSGLSVTSDSIGEFFVPLKHPGTYLVRVTAEGFGEEVAAVTVKKNEVAESSQLLDPSNRKPISAGLWADFDQRLRWRPPSSAVVSGAEIRSYGGTITDGLLASPAIARLGMKLGETCIYVNGQPRPGLGLSDIRPEEVRAVEVYSDLKKDEVYVQMLKEMWPVKLSCGGGGSAALSRGRSVAKTRAAGKPPAIKWVVIWLK